MRIIHCADLHLDSKMESNLDADKAKQRRDELLDTFERMVDFAVADRVSVIMIAGDLFDKQHIRKTAGRRVMDQIYEHPEIDFLYLQGNHDRTDFLQAIDEDSFPENLKLFSSESWMQYVYDDVVITGREISDDNYKTLSTDLVLDQQKINIVMLHGQESNYVGRDKTHTINLTELRNKYIDYLALGHIHTYKEDRLDDRGMYCYCGCLEGRGFDECGEKGFVELVIEDGEISRKFISIAKRELHEVEVPLEIHMSTADMLGAVEDRVKNIPSKDLVKIVLTGEKEMDADIDMRRIRKEYYERFYFLKVYDRTSIKIDYDSFKLDRSLKGEFVRLMQAQEMSEEKRAAIIELGIKAVMGEEIGE
ncbi:MAG: metallophosphoesterase [Lachnospiraceae bacterium]|nr:metallophosphoesterase [Lachnospiraceae bacterium]